MQYMYAFAPLLYSLMVLHTIYIMCFVFLWFWSFDYWFVLECISWHHLYYFYVAKAGDWLQGPYVYYLYSSYGFGKRDIGQLFIAGFGSSMLFGTIVGSLADKQWESLSFFMFKAVLSEENLYLCVCFGSGVERGHVLHTALFTY